MASEKADARSASVIRFPDPSDSAVDNAFCNHSFVFALMCFAPSATTASSDFTWGMSEVLIMGLLESDMD